MVVFKGKGYGDEHPLNYYLVYCGFWCNLLSDFSLFESFQSKLN